MDYSDVDILIGEPDVQARVKEMAEQISHDYAGEELLVVGILKGAFIFMSDLVRQIEVPTQLDFMDVSSYGASTESSGEVRIIKDLEQPIEGRHVLIVEDIIDTGVTLKYIVDILKRRKPASLKLCTFLDKPIRRKAQVTVDYTGFTIPDHFIVGYGLDYAERYRTLPCICILKPEVYQK